jgi:hypothetical protein
MMKVINIVQNGSLIAGIPQITLEKRYLSSLPNGTKIMKELKPIRKGKTHQQVKTIFGLVIMDALSQFEDKGIGTDEILHLEMPTGNAITMGFLKEYLYAVCPMYNEDGKRITLSHRDCTTKSAHDFIDAARNHLASQWQVYIADPDPNWKEQ